MADLSDNAVDDAIAGSIGVTDEDELDQVLDAAQQAWDKGETLLMWIDQYPDYALQLGELALGLERQRLAPEPAEEANAEAGKSFLQVMDAMLRSTKYRDNSG